MNQLQKFIEERNKVADIYSKLRPIEMDIVESINTIRLIYSDESLNKSYFNIFDQDVRLAKLVDIRKDKIINEILAQKLTGSDGKETAIPYIFAKITKVTQAMLNNTADANYGYYNRFGINVPHYLITFDVTGVDNGGTYNVIADISNLKEYSTILMDYCGIHVSTRIPVYASYRNGLNKVINNFYTTHNTKINFNLVDDKKIKRNIHVSSANRFFDSAWIYFSTLKSRQNGTEIQHMSNGFSTCDSSAWGPIPHINIYNTDVETFNFCSDTSEPTSSVGVAYDFYGVSRTLTPKMCKGQLAGRRMGGDSIDNGGYRYNYMQAVLYSYACYFTGISGSFTHFNDYQKGRAYELGMEYWQYNNLTINGLETTVYPAYGYNSIDPYDDRISSSAVNEINSMTLIPSNKSTPGYLKRPTLNFYNCNVIYHPNIVYQYSLSKYDDQPYVYESTNIPAYYYNCNVKYTPVSTYVYKGKTTKYVPTHKVQGILLYPFNTSYFENCILTIKNPNKLTIPNDFEYKNTHVILEDPINIPYVSLDNTIFTGKDLINVSNGIKFYNIFDQYKQPFIRYTKDYYTKSHLLFENCGSLDYDTEDLSTVIKMPADNIFLNSALYYGFNKTRGLEIDNSLLSFSSGPIYSDTDANTYYLANKIKIANSPNFLNKIWKTTLNEYIVRLHPQYLLNQTIYIYNDSDKDIMLVRPKTKELTAVFQALSFEYNTTYQAFIIPPNYIMDKYYILLLENIDGDKSSLIYDPVLGFVASTFTDKSDIFTRTAIAKTYNKSSTFNAINLGVNELSTDYNDETDYKYEYGLKLVGVYTVYKKIISDIEYNQNYNTIMVNDSIQTIELEEITKRFVEN